MLALAAPQRGVAPRLHHHLRSALARAARLEQPLLHVAQLRRGREVRGRLALERLREALHLGLRAGVRGDELSALARERHGDRLLRARGREPRSGPLALGAQRRELPEFFFERAERAAARRDPLLELRDPRAQRRFRIDITLERFEPRSLLRHLGRGRGDHLLRQGIAAPRAAGRREVSVVRGARALEQALLALATRAHARRAIECGDQTRRARERGRIERRALHDSQRAPERGVEVRVE